MKIKITAVRLAEELPPCVCGLGTDNQVYFWDDEEDKWALYRPRPEIIIWRGKEKTKGYKVPLFEQKDYDVDHLLPLFKHEAVMETLPGGGIRITMEIDPYEYSGTEVCRAVKDEFVDDWLELWRGDFWGKDDGRLIYQPQEGDTAFIRYEVDEESADLLQKYLGMEGVK